MTPAASTRRRFIAIAAAVLGAPAAARLLQQRHEAPQLWTGVALGAEVRIELLGATPQRAQRLFARISRLLESVEEHFSLYRDSALTRLNRTGRLAYPPPALQEIFELSGRVHAATGGAFDPTIQPLWLALATAGDVAAARARTGWPRVRFASDEIALEPDMQLTFNGVAQGHAADQVAALLRTEGFANVLIDTGEIAGLGVRPDHRPWQAAIALPDGTVIGETSLSDRALAVSSPLGTRIGNGLPHIVDPHGGAPRWQLVAVSASRAAVADALSTAFCLMDRRAIAHALAHFPEARIESLM